ncbi:AroM protein [Salmonella enterica subsp. arizonae]|uniref:AroM protein n=1 Tax=Salmonella enterica subsp. arizonae TaxID=59203 RepID=A0A379TET9_SALER|nr:AroM protein [Salmonella enterica subsp. arizonae]
MSASLAILTIGVVPMSEVLPLLTEYIDEQHITHHSLLGKMSRERRYGGLRRRAWRRSASDIVE